MPSFEQVVQKDLTDEKKEGQVANIFQIQESNELIKGKVMFSSRPIEEW